MREVISSRCAVNPGANNSVTLYDDASFDDATSARIGRIVTMAHLDQNFAINVWCAKNKDASSILRLVESTSYTGGVDSHVLPVRATQPITAVAVASLVNNDRFTVVLTVTRNGVVESTTTHVFEYQVDGTFTPVAGRTTIDVSGVATDVEVAVATAAAVAAKFGADKVTAAVPVAATFTLTSANSGTSFALSATENVANAGFTIGVATAGVDGTVVRHSVARYPGRMRVDLDTGTAPVEFDVRTDAIDDVESGV